LAGFAGGRGKPVVFSSADAAEKAAGEVCLQMLLATPRPCTPLLDQLQKHQQQQSAGKGRDKQQMKQRREKNNSSSGNSRQQPGGLLAPIAAGFKSVSAAGLPLWHAHVSWFDDPFGLPAGQQVSNMVCTIVKVQVVDAEML
jgi:hypothetical protein